MKGTISVACSCGQVLVGRDDEELYGVVRSHIDPLHPEAHQPVLDDVQGYELHLDSHTETSYSSSRVRSTQRVPAF